MFPFSRLRLQTRIRWWIAFVFEHLPFEVSRWFKLDSLEGKSLKESLKLLLLDFRDYQSARLKHVQERTDALLRELQEEAKP
jgi:hypothetical protein